MRKHLAYAVLAATTAALAAPAQAQTGYPERVVSIVVPYSPGGSTDVVTRVIADELSRRTGSSFIVENMTGAGGAIAWGNVAQAAPDGYRIITTDLTMSFAPSLFPNLAVDPVNSFDHIAIAAQVPHVLVVSPTLEVESVEELIAFARQDPGALAFGSGGLGTNTHVTAELFKSYAGVDMLHIPYQGAGAVLTDLMRGDVHVLFTAVPTALSHIEAGSLRPLMVTAAERVPTLPDVPSAPEVGLPDLISNFWVGYAAPAGTSGEIVGRLSAVIAEIAADPAVIARLAELGYSPLGNSPEEASAFVAAEIARWGEVVANADIELE